MISVHLFNLNTNFKYIVIYISIPSLLCGKILLSSHLWNCLTGATPLDASFGPEIFTSRLFGFLLALSGWSKLWSLKYKNVNMVSKQANPLI